MENISRKEREGHKYLITNIQHESEHEKLQVLQRYALNGNHQEFFELLETISGADKRRDIIELCNMQGVA